MSRILREDKTCQNCGHYVAEKFCPNCGQLNTETVQSFHHLFSHFVEDLTHYDSSFWKSAWFLIIKPIYLTKTYLSGKRQSYLPPVRMYIFVSFLTFFLLHVLPDPSYIENGNVSNIKFDFNPTLNLKSGDSVKLLDTVKTVADYRKLKANIADEDFKNSNGLDNIIVENYLDKKHKYGSIDEFQRKFTEVITNNIPKALFLYMPVFAFFLWLFHNKKKWWFFQSGIYTLHFFASMLICYLILRILILLLDQFNLIDFDLQATFISFLFLFFIIRFYRSHRKMFEEDSFMSFIKVSFLLLINFFLAFIFLLGLSIYSFNSL